MTNAKSSNIIYGIFIVFTMLVIGIILAFKGTKERESSSVDYDNSLSVGGYAVKINNCIYFTDTNEIASLHTRRRTIQTKNSLLPAPILTRIFIISRSILYQKSLIITIKIPMMTLVM